ncbi:hypothetical protein [Hyphomicrobium sp. DY-1]|uniref:hypothetical protein n=1 Tax=Hyphomicrobium sp. DY-1 TaxID=3075650 RepID=UPI0039C1F82B
MSFTACIDRALKAKKITGQKAKEVKERFDNLYAEYTKGGMSGPDAEVRASRQAIIIADAEVTYRTRGKMKDMELALNYQDGLRSFNGGKGQKFGIAAQSFIEKDARGSTGNYVARRDKYRGMFHAIMDEAIEKYSPKIAGIYRPVKGLENIIRELFGEDTKDMSAKAIAAAWTKATDTGVELWNHHGGALLRRLDWRVPQQQSRVKLAKIGEDAWVKDHMSWMDWSKVRRSDASLVPEADREKVLRDVYKTLKTDGKWKAPGTVGATATGNLLEASRFLVFKDAASWLAMHEKYGDGNVFEVMTGHLDERAHQLALLETFGRSPERMAEMLKAQAKNYAAVVDANHTGPAKNSVLDKTVEDLKHFDAMFDIITRKNTVGAENKVAHVMSGLRNVITANVLGSASLAAIPGDLMTSALARHAEGLPYIRALGTYLKLLNPLDHSTQRLARQAGLVDDAATTMAYASQRFSAINTYGPAWTKRLSDVTLRLSLLTPHTQAARWAHGLELMGFLHELRGTKFDDLPILGTFRKYGIDAQDWTEFSQLAPWEPQPGWSMLRPADLLDGKITPAKLRLHDKFMSMIVDEGKVAVPDATVGAAATLKGGAVPGTLRGELLASGAMFKNFPVTVCRMYSREAMIRATWQGRAAFVAALGIGFTMSGALAMQLGELANGREPIAMTRPDFWARAVLKGGALGVYGDFLFSNVNTFGRGLGEQLAGPLWTIMDDVKNLTIGNVQDALNDKQTHIGADALKLGAELAPGKSLWYARLAFERMVVEQIQRSVDPKAASKWQRRQTQQFQNSGNRYWWPPGHTSP